MLGIFSLQIVLPFILSASLLFVTLWQRNLISQHRNNSNFFQQIRIPQNDKDIAFLNQDEFSYKGVLYDINSIKKENGDYVILAIADKSETKIQKTVVNQNESNEKQNTTTVKSFPFLFLFFEQTRQSMVYARYFQEHTTTPYLYYLSADYTQIVVPPPQGIRLFV